MALATRLLPDVAAQAVLPDDAPPTAYDLGWWTMRPDAVPRQYPAQGGQGWPVTIMVYPMGEERVQVYLSANQA